MTRSSDLSDFPSSRRGRPPSSHRRDFPSSQFSRDTQSSKADSSASTPEITPSLASSTLASDRGVSPEQSGGMLYHISSYTEKLIVCCTGIRKRLTRRPVDRYFDSSNVPNKRKSSFDDTSMAPRKIRKLRSDWPPQQVAGEVIDDSEEEASNVSMEKECGDEGVGDENGGGISTALKKPEVRQPASPSNYLELINPLWYQQSTQRICRSRRYRSINGNKIFCHPVLS